MNALCKPRCTYSSILREDEPNQMPSPDFKKQFSVSDFRSPLVTTSCSQSYSASHGMCPLRSHKFTFSLWRHVMTDACDRDIQTLWRSSNKNIVLYNFCSNITIWNLINRTGFEISYCIVLQCYDMMYSRYENLFYDGYIKANMSCFVAPR